MLVELHWPLAWAGATGDMREFFRQPEVVAAREVVWELDRKWSLVEEGVAEEAVAEEQEQEEELWFRVLGRFVFPVWQRNHFEGHSNP